MVIREIEAELNGNSLVVSWNITRDLISITKLISILSKGFFIRYYEIIFEYIKPIYNFNNMFEE